VLALPSAFFDVPAIELWLPLAAGARVLVAPDDVAADGRRLSRLVSAEHASLLHARPATWQALLESGLRPARGLAAVSSGEPLGRELADALLKRSRVLWNGYGAPQMGGFATLGRVEADGPLTIGRPLANRRAYVVDGRDRPVPVGVAGELLIARDGASRAGAAHRTGDRARWLADGRLQLAGAPGRS
jgi:non-ribosomal peptide synthetase component F